MQPSGRKCGRRFQLISPSQLSCIIRAVAIGPAIALCFSLLPGCGKEALPKTYIVQGKVILKNSKPLKGGTITFTSVKNPEHRGYGTIESDGTFTLDTVALRSDATSAMLKGGIEGEFIVSIRPESGAAEGTVPAGNSKAAQEFTLKKKYIIEPKELNELTVVFE